jgi:hypothetical protein
MAREQPPHVNTGGGLYTSGNVHGHEIVGRDKHVDNRSYGSYAGRDNIHISHVFPHYTMLRTGRVLQVLGLATFVTGFAMFGYVVVSFITAGFSAVSENSEPDLTNIPFVPYLPLGFGLAATGIVISMLGAFFVRRTK